MIANLKKLLSEPGFDHLVPVPRDELNDLINAFEAVQRPDLVDVVNRFEDTLDQYRTRVQRQVVGINNLMRRLQQAKAELNDFSARSLEAMTLEDLERLKKVAKILAGTIAD